MERHRIVITCHLVSPQGSCLGSLLFSAYASKLFEVNRLYLPNGHAFTDDTQLYLSFNPDNSLNEAEAVHAMEQCIRAIRAWMQSDKLKLNENKIEVMCGKLLARQQLSKVNVGTLTVGDTSVLIVNKARNLGVWFDSQLNLTFTLLKHVVYPFVHHTKLDALESTFCTRCTNTNLSTSNWMPRLL